MSQVALFKEVDLRSSSDMESEKFVVADHSEEPDCAFFLTKLW